MAHRVVKPFPYYEDGITRVDLEIGDEREFGDLTDGLLAEGWIEPAEKAAKAPKPQADAVDQAAKGTK